MGFINLTTGTYYVGHKHLPTDIEVSDRPSINYFYQDGIWVLNIQKEQEEKSQILRQISTDLIYEKAPVFKQNNAALGILSEEEVLVIKNWIIAVRQSVNELLIDINNSKTEQELELIIFDYDSIKSKTEELFNTL